ncbi:hypothetical protein DEU56DRAFT_912021 [Suillus clintonianus]|uniref:uncharacterized protein n=1 Tax=Suillus clintonianus TaxID=1904413 RepID=UPI001B88518E|nr:uncharacterized protein DEU56DRAFT_912021 [Suillus clintonianus]KAG2139757.1 hypothetical protein DEU56DRAFT_912021 [Suillus clintonianus]
MQLSAIFSALVSFVILAAASPTPRAIEQLSSKREELDTNSQRDLLEEGRKLDELETNSVTYISYVTRDGLVIPEGITKKREELDTGTIIYAWYDGPGGGDKKREELETNFVDHEPREELETNFVGYIGYNDRREELETNFVDYDAREELETNFVGYIGYNDRREELETNFVGYIGYND